MKFIDRLIIYIDYKGISLNSFDKAIGTGNGYIGKQIKNKASVGADIIEKIISVYTDLSIEWLITGNGEMIKVERPPNENSTDADKKVIHAQEETIETQRKYIRHLEEQLNKREEPVEDGQKRKAG